MFGLLALTFAIYAGIIFVIAKIIKENTGITIGLSIIFATIFLIVIGIALYYEVGYVIGFAILGAVILFAFGCLINYMLSKTKRVFISFASTCCLIVPIVIFSVLSIYPHPICKSHILVSNAPYAYANQEEKVEIKNDAIPRYNSTGYLSYYYFVNDTIKPYEDEREYRTVASLYYSSEDNCINVAAYGEPTSVSSLKKSENIKIVFSYNYVDEVFIKTKTTAFAEELLQTKVSIALKERGFDYFNKALNKQGMNVFEALKRSGSHYYDEEIRTTRNTNLICLGIFSALFLGNIIVMAVFLKKDKNIVIPKKEKPVNKKINIFKASFVKKDNATLTYSYKGRRREDIAAFSYDADVRITSFANCRVGIILGYHRGMPTSGSEIVNLIYLPNAASSYQDKVFIEKNYIGFCNCIESIFFILDDGKVTLPLLACGQVTMGKTAEEFLKSLFDFIEELQNF